MAGQAPGTTTSPTGASVAGWAGLLVPYDRPSVDGRLIRRPPGGARVRDLPIELKYQESATCGHDNALIGLAAITRTWETEEGLWGSGPFDVEDPRGAELARKVHQGFVGHVSVDLGDFKTAAQQSPKGMVEAVTDWKLLSTTIVADAALDGARIFTVENPDNIVPMSTALGARREAAGVFSVADTATLTFAGKKQEASAPDLTLTVTGASDLPWAPREHAWDAAAASRRMVQHCGGKDNLNPACFARGHMYRESDTDPGLIGSYKFPFADVVNGQVRAVYRGVAAAAGRIDQAGITSADKEAIKGKIRSLYSSAAKAFNDDKITAPFDAATAKLRTHDMADEEPVQELAETAPAPGDAAPAAELDSLVEAIVQALAPRLEEAITRAVDKADRRDDEETVTVEELPDGPSAAEMSAAILRMARAAAQHAIAERGARLCARRVGGRGEPAPNRPAG